ncbi:MAG: hypothetical protein ACP5I1_05605 [Candidatus Hinthialibacter sp.]
MINQLVEIHLLNGKRFFGKVMHKDSEGVILYGVPVKGLESITPGSKALEELREMLHTVFFAWQQVEYIDIGGEPVGFESLYSSWFKDQSLGDFFEKPYISEKEKKES